MMTFFRFVETMTMTQRAGSSGGTIDNNDDGNYDGDNNDDPYKYRELVKKWIKERPHEAAEIADTIERTLYDSEPKLRVTAHPPRSNKLPSQGQGWVYVEWFLPRNHPLFQQAVQLSWDKIIQSSLWRYLGFHNSYTLQQLSKNLAWEDMILSLITGMAKTDVRLKAYMAVNPNNIDKKLKNRIKNRVADAVKYQLRVPVKGVKLSFPTDINGRDNPAQHNFDFDGRYGDGREFDLKNGAMRLTAHFFFSYLSQ